MNFYKVKAIFKKTFKDFLKNKRELLVFVIFPIMTYAFYYMMPESSDTFSMI